MSTQPTSRNFGFLFECEPLLHEYAFRAELTAYDDPNTSLLKIRQFAELLSKAAAAHAGMDCTSSTFEQTVSLLRRQRLVPGEIHSHFDVIRLLGNSAAHEHVADAREALRALICALELGQWFAKCVLQRQDVVRSPFKPLPTPANATNELAKEIDHLREEVARSQLAATATEAQVRELSDRLEHEGRLYFIAVKFLASRLVDREKDIARLEQESTSRLQQVIKASNSRAFLSFVNRSAESASRLWSVTTSQLPLTQLRITTGSQSTCCRAPMIVVQSKAGGFVTKNCSKCNNPSSLTYREFVDLHIYVRCGKCSLQAMPTLLHRNYGYKCTCGWGCELATLIAHYVDA